MSQIYTPTFEGSPDGEVGHVKVLFIPQIKAYYKYLDLMEGL
jgi:hypothetical protein